MAPNATIQNPTHPVVLTDSSGTAVGGMLSDPRGNNDVLNISRSPYPRTGLKISQQDTKYSDEELPFTNQVQDDFSGGRGAEKFEDDKTRLADEYRCETRFPNVVFPGAQERYTAIAATVLGENWFTATDRETDEYWIGGNTNAIARKFTAAATATAKAVLLMLDTLSDPGGYIQCEIYSNLAGVPNVSLGIIGKLSASQCKHGIYPYLFQDETGVALTSGTVYWLVVSNVATNVTVVFDEDTAKTGNLMTTTNSGGSWSAHSGDLYFRVTILPTNSKAKFITYRGALYCATNNGLFINGDRGVADASAATTLVDATKAAVWTANEFTGAVCYIFRGTGSGQYRTIASNTTTVLTLSKAWDTTPDTTSEYVILGANAWRSVIAGVNFMDVAVAGDFLYYTEGSVSVYNCYNLGGTFTTRSTAMSTVVAKKLLATYDSGARKWILWGADNSESYHGIALWKLTVPPVWGASNLFNDKGTLYNFASPWDDYVATNVSIAKGTEDDSMDVNVAAGFTTGLLATKNIAALDLTQGRYFAFAIKSTVVTADTNDLYFCYCSDELAPNSYISAPNVSGRQRPPDMVYEFDGTTTFTDLANARDGRVASNVSVTIVTTDFIYIGSSRPFDSVRFDVGTVNAVASALTASYMSTDSGLWKVLTVTDDGTANPAGTPLAKDGNMTFTAPYDWQAFTVNSQTLYWIRLSFGTNLTAPITINEITVWLSASTIAIPDLAADTWTWVRLTATLLSRPYPDDSAITSIGLYLATDLGAQIISLRDSIHITDYLEEYMAVQTKSRINNLIAYGSENLNPFIITDGELFEVQTQNSDVVVKVPLEELSVLSSPDTGLGACTNDVYLYFTMGKRIERYHEGLLENQGPDLDNGLPTGRAGIVSSLFSLPGGSIGAIVQGSEQHSILVRKGGWHEVYRAPYSTYKTASANDPLATEIGGATVQEVPGVGTVLWAYQGGSIIKMNFPLSETDAGGNYLFGSYIVTPWISLGFLDVQKRLMLMKLFSLNLSSTDATKAVLSTTYQIDDGDLDTIADWHDLLVSYTTSPFESHPVHATATGYDYAEVCRRIRFKLIFFNYIYTVLPKLKAWILSALLSLDVRYMYNIRIRLDDHQIDLTGNQDNTYQAATTLATLDGWAASPPDVLTMTTMYPTMTSKTVIVLPFPIKPYNFRPDDKEEGVYADIQVLEVA